MLLPETIVPIDNSHNWKKEILKILRGLWTGNNKDQQQHQIEIEMKYAYRDSPEQLAPTQRFLQAISRQFPILLRQSSLPTCGIFYSRLKAGFMYGPNRYYMLKQYLQGLSDANNSGESKSAATSNVFARDAQATKNTGFYFKEKTLRLDVNFTSKQNNRCRYTYSHGKGWEKLLKNKIMNGDPYNPSPIEGLDLLFNQKQFRLTFNSEQIEYTFNLNSELRQAIESKQDAIHLRLKNISKYEKDQLIEISLSQVLTVKSPECIKELLENLDYPAAMNKYLVDLFANFYSSDWVNERRFEIEAQITPLGMEQLKFNVEQGKHAQVEALFDKMILDMASLYWADYRVHVQNTQLLAEKFKAVIAGGKPKFNMRLNHLIGNYMHTQLRNFMNDKNLKNSK